MKSNEKKELKPYLSVEETVTFTEQYEKGWSISGDVLIDFGCGTAPLARAFAPSFSSVICYEPSKSMRVIASEVLGNFKNTSITDSWDSIVESYSDKVDTIVMSAVWHFLSAAEMIQKWVDFASLLKPCGRIIVLEPGPNARWGVGYLRYDSPEFDPVRYAKKVSALGRAKKFLEEQDVFQCISGHSSKKSWYVFFSSSKN